MYRVIMDFDSGEIRIPREVAQALDMPPGFSWLVHRGKRQLIITRYIDPAKAFGERQHSASKRKPRLRDSWNADEEAYCLKVTNGCLQLIGNLIPGFDGSGIYALDGGKKEAFGEPVVVFDLGRAG